MTPLKITSFILLAMIGDFSILHKSPLGVSDSMFLCFVMHKGLLHLFHRDGMSQVHNPATKQIYYVPKSPIVQKYGFNHHLAEEIPGLIIQLPTYLTVSCHFVIVRFCYRFRIMEVYYSVPRKWVRFRLTLGEQLLSPVCWRLKNYVGFFESEVLSLYVLTTKDCGIAVKFKGPMNSETRQYSFPLPKVVHGGIGNTRIWECENSLYLSYYNATALWIWKAICTKYDMWTWVPMFEISRARQACKPVARQHLSKHVLNASVRVMVLACHPNAAVVYILVLSTVFAYNLNEDTLDRIGEIKDHEQRSLDVVQTFVPCLSFMDADVE